MKISAVLLATVLVSVVAPVFAGGKKDKQDKKHHVLYVLCDDCGWTDVGYHGSDFPSPNIDELARDGIRMDRFYTQETCSPTRSSLMTGKHPFKTGVQRPCTPATNDHLPVQFETAGEMFSAAGYSTHYIGKWHLGYASYSYFPTNRGFDSFVGYMQPTNFVYDHIISVAGISGFDFWNGTELLRDPTGVHNNKVFLEELDRVVENVVEEGKTSFVYFSPASIHEPMEWPPANYSACDSVTPTDRQTLCNMLGDFDETVGEIVATYKKAGIWENTLMVFMSDNGGNQPGAEGVIFPPSQSSNFPLRGGKGTLFEGGVRSLGFFQGGDDVIPSNVRGTINKDLIAAVDVLPTAYTAATSRSLRADIDGINQWDALTGTSEGLRTELPINIQESGAVIIVGEWKLIIGAQPYDGFWTVSPYSYVDAPTHGAVNGTDYLFNIYDDPTEQFNLAATFPSIVEDLKTRIEAYFNSSSYMAASTTDLTDMIDEALPANNDGVWLPFLDA